MKTLAAITLATGFLVAAPALADDSKIDMSKLTCSQFSKYDKTNLGSIMMWLEGYYTEDEDNPVVDFSKMAGDTAQLLLYCGNHPDADIISAADEIMGKDDNSDDQGNDDGKDDHEDQ